MGPRVPVAILAAWLAVCTAELDAGECLGSAFLNSSIFQNREIFGRFADGYANNVTGSLVLVVGTDGDDTGCSLSSWQRLPRNYDSSWIGLVRRGACSFQEKLDNALKSNASGLIVFNERNSSYLDKMKLSRFPSQNITAVLTYKWKGELLSELLRNGTDIVVQITSSASCSKHPVNLNKTSVLLVSISFIVLMVVSLAWLVFYYIQRFRYIHAKDRLSRKLCSAAKKALSKIPTKNVKIEDKELQEGECCPICIEMYKTTDIVRILPCSHEFHKNCIDPWLLDHRTCPMCKMDILKYYGFAISGSQESILQAERDENLNDEESGHSQNMSPVTVEIPPGNQQVHSVILYHVLQKTYSSQSRANFFCVTIPRPQVRTVFVLHRESTPVTLPSRSPSPILVAGPSSIIHDSLCRTDSNSLSTDNRDFESIEVEI